MVTTRAATSSARYSKAADGRPTAEALNKEESVLGVSSGHWMDRGSYLEVLAFKAQLAGFLQLQAQRAQLQLVLEVLACLSRKDGLLLPVHPGVHLGPLASFSGVCYR